MIIEFSDKLYRYIWVVVDGIGQKFHDNIQVWFDDNKVPCRFINSDGILTIELDENDYIMLCMKYL